MADTSPLAGLLGRANRVFLLAHQLGQTFHQEHERQSEIHQIDRTGWDRHQPAFDEFCAAVQDLRGTMQNPPEGFAPVAQALLQAARVAEQIRAAMQTADGQTWAAYLDFFPELHSAAAAGRDAIKEVSPAWRPDAPSGLVKEPAGNQETGIDTTPALPQPPRALIEAAERDIPVILANVQPEYDGTIELVASSLARRLQDAKHTLAAAQWAIHEGIQVGRLRAGRVVVGIPLVFRPGARLDGGQGIIPPPKGRPAPFDSFKVVATESLWTWWRSQDAVASPKDEAAGDAGQPVEPLPAGSADVEAKSREKCEIREKEKSPTEPAPKRSTVRGEARDKLIAALTKHHQYADSGCLNLEPVGNNELARLAEVAKRTASAFFKKEFQGHDKYRAACRDAHRLAMALKLLNGEFAAHVLYGNTPPEKADWRGDVDEE